MQEGDADLRFRPALRHNKVPLFLITDTEGSTTPSLPPPSSRVRSVLAASSPSSSSSSAAPSSPSSLSSSSSSTSSVSSAFSSSSSSSSVSSPSSWQRRSDSSRQRRRSKPVGDRQKSLLPKPFSEPSMLTMEDTMAMEADAEKSSVQSHGVYRRCMTDTDFKNVHGIPSQAAPDLLQLFNIFQFNKPEKPPARILINVTLVGNIQPVRLLVAHDASVQDVIKASVKACVKEGRLPRHCIKYHNYGLHYSSFCLENIDPTEHICSLGTRSFYLFSRVSQPTSPTQNSQETKPWWNIFGLMLP